ncbi:MAG: hypothetical protein KC448_03175 [Yoonia sp.]|nr:hypothetical protein [Yoonia sp.]
MTPEVTLLIVNAIFLAFAYLWVYPGLTTKTINLILIYDAVISCAALLVAGLLFWGSGTDFSLIFVSTNWAVFAIITLGLMEIPLFAWFAKKYDLDI